MNNNDAYQNQSYLQQRLLELNIKSADNCVTTKVKCNNEYHEVELPVFTSNERGDIEILYTGLNHLHTINQGGEEVPYKRLRVHPNRCINGNKYITPKGARTYAFFPPPVIEKFKKESIISTLFITEGEFKAFKACMHGVNCISVQGIHNIAEKDGKTKQLNSEIELLIKTCKVKNVGFLLDSDCLEVVYNPTKDLSTRLNSFYTAVRNFREYTKHLNCDVYFTHIKQEAKAKGLDDLYVLHKNDEEMVSQKLLELKASEFFFFLNVTDNSLKKLLDYFHIKSVQDFYEAYQSILTGKPFIFRGNKYQYNGEKLELTFAKEIGSLIRVGDKYYEEVLKPSVNGELKPTLILVEKQTILDDLKKKIPNVLDIIPKYKGFCNVPGHLRDYKKEIKTAYGKWYNLYLPLSLKPYEGDITQSLAFAKHIFGEQYELGLDYLQLLLLNPTQPLYVLCLVSEENISGKNTVADWLKILFGDNITISSSQDFDDAYNDDYISKLAIVIDESQLRKDRTKDYIKALSTGKVAKLNAKFVNRTEVEIFLKFIILSNNEDKFLNIDSQDTRFWVRKIPKPPVENVNLLADLTREAPAFLHFLSTRKMLYPEKKSRMWFPPEVIRTAALEKVIEANRSLFEVDIEEYITEMLINFNLEQFQIDAKNLIAEINKVSKYRHTIKEVHAYLKKRRMKLSGPTQFKIPYHMPNERDIIEVHETIHLGRVYTFKRSEWVLDESSN